MAHGDRMLLVFRTDGDHFARAQSQLVIEPGQQRQARLAAQLTEITGPLARTSRQAAAGAGRHRPGAGRAAARVRGAGGTGRRRGVVPGLGQNPDLLRYERVAVRAAARMRQTSPGSTNSSIPARGVARPARLRTTRSTRRDGDAEDVQAEELYARAYDALRAKPCDVAAAESAVRRYTADHRRRGARRARPAGSTGGEGRPGGHDGRPTGDGDVWQ